LAVLLRHVWRRPRSSFWLAAGGLVALSLWDGQEWPAHMMERFKDWLVWSAVSEGLRCVRSVCAAVLFGLPASALAQVSESIADPDMVASPHLAYFMWSFVALESRVSPHVNVKKLVHLSLFTFSLAWASYSSPSAAQTSLLTRALFFFSWLGIHILVAHYESDQRREAEVSWLHAQKQRRSLTRQPVSRDQFRDEFDQRECAICLDCYSPGAAITSLPCKHAFHSGCISTWLSASNRCPLCRQAAGGIDLALEFLF